MVSELPCNVGEYAESLMRKIPLWGCANHGGRSRHRGLAAPKRNLSSRPNLRPKRLLKKPA